jgi:6-pyruvoyltetrahydropterin/6-carboxytetrahydropterin synthase
MSKKVAVFRREHFNAAHRLFVPTWDDKKNDEVFGKCNNPNFHGHNYELEVKLIGVPDVQTGYVMDLKQLSDIIQTHVLEKFDHKNLNLDTTAENIVVVIYEILRKEIPIDLSVTVRLYETERNFVEYPAGQ